MKESSQDSQPTPGTRIRCREAKGQLELHLPPSRRRVLARFGGMLVLFVFLAGFFVAVFFLTEGFLPVVLAIGTVEVIIFVAALAAMAAPYLTATSVLMTTDRVVVKTVLYGKENVQEYALDGQSRPQITLIHADQASENLR